MKRKLTMKYLVAVVLMKLTFISKHISNKMYFNLVFNGYTGYPLNIDSPQYLTKNAMVKVE